MVVKKESVSIYFENETVVSHDSCRKGVWNSEDVYKAMASCLFWVTSLRLEARATLLKAQLLHPR